MIRSCVGEVWIGYDIVQMFSWVLGTGCLFCSQSPGLVSLLQLLMGRILSSVMVQLAAFDKVQEKLWELNGGILPFHSGYSILETHICYNFTKPELSPKVFLYIFILSFIHFYKLIYKLHTKKFNSFF